MSLEKMIGQGPYWVSLHNLMGGNQISDETEVSYPGYARIEVADGLMMFPAVIGDGVVATAIAIGREKEGPIGEHILIDLIFGQHEWEKQVGGFFAAGLHPGVHLEINT
jgi:hypothetical protein